MLFSMEEIRDNARARIREEKKSFNRGRPYLFSPSGGAFDRQMAHLSKPKLGSEGTKLLAEKTLAMLCGIPWCSQSEGLCIRILYIICLST